nr:hypothetical protein [Tanacetum cinerariifolium]
MILTPRYDNKNSGNGRDQRNRGHQSNRGSQQSRGPSEGYSYPVCTTCGRRHQGECRRAAGTCFKCGQAGHLQKDCKKNTTTSTSGQARSLYSVVLKESGNVWNLQRWWVSSMIVLESMTIHFEIATIWVDQLDGSVRVDFRNGEWAEPTGL